MKVYFPTKTDILRNGNGKIFFALVFFAKINFTSFEQDMLQNVGL